LILDALQILEHHRQTWVELTEKLREERPSAAAAVDEDSGQRSWST
jgi:hypothetical protein